jgi:hypothetical protein
MSGVITLTTSEALQFALRYPDHCTAQVSRRGESTPCERRAVAVCHDPEGGVAAGLYAVCAYHANRNGSCVALSEIIRLVKEQQ